jgi:hypothetical protein
MRHLRKLLTFAARTLVNESASGGACVPRLHVAPVPAAAAARGWHAHTDGPYSWTTHPFQLAVSGVNCVLSCKHDDNQWCFPV